MNKINSQFSSIEQVTGEYLKGKKTGSSNLSVSELSFEEILQQKQKLTKPQEIQELKFSKHASQRLEERNMNLSQEQKVRLETGAIRAGEKGIKESLVIVDSMAFIVNVPNNTVVTAMDQNDSADHIFTNIDGAVIM
ncbi:MAG: TIGR02530 family flagellar biosynthesis protein [Lachnospiraceae bacterium]